MGAERFSWLHLTDFHYGLRGQGSLWPTLREPFLEDLAKLHDQSGPWEAVFFTGDFVQSGSPEQFAQMQNEVLDRLWTRLHELGSGDAVLLAVPGNHDLRRPDPRGDNAAIDTLLNPGSFHSIADKFWDAPDGSYRRVINDAFDAYKNWWGGVPRRPTSEFTEGALPGDFACTLSCGEHRIGVVGLNTTFLQLQGGDYRRQLAWHPQQLQQVCGGAVDDWVKKHNACILLTHQGPDWLTPESEKLGATEIAPAGRFAAHLFGHMHETKISYLKIGGGEAVRQCQGNSVFGMEKYGDPPTMIRTHGYAAGRIEFSDTAGFRVWPRVATSKTGPWRFIPDYENADLLDDQGTRPETVSVRSTTSKLVGLEEGLKAGEDAERLQQGLAEEQPDTYTGRWASSLSNLSVYLGEVGRFAEAVAMAAKAESLWRGLANKQPDTYTDDWAHSLHNLAAHLREINQYEEALKAAQTAERLTRGLAENQPDVYATSWGAALSNLADSFVAVGRFDEALSVAKAALKQMDGLAKRHPRVYRPWLGMAHRVAAEAHFGLNQIEDAASEAQQSIAIWIEIAQDRQNYESPQIAKAFRIFLKCEIAYQRNDTVTTVLAQAFSVLRRPLEMNPRPLRSLMLELVELAKPVSGEAVLQEFLLSLKAGS